LEWAWGCIGFGGGFGDFGDYFGPNDLNDFVGV
jgi:hypothetical protein